MNRTINKILNEIIEFAVFLSVIGGGYFGWSFFDVNLNWFVIFDQVTFSKVIDVLLGAVIGLAGGVLTFGVFSLLLSIEENTRHIEENTRGLVDK